MISSNDSNFNNNLSSLLNTENQEQKKEKIIEIMKMKFFKPEEKEDETIYLSNSWGYGINERSFIGK